MTMPLEGITVLDLCGFPGVWTAMALADFGAEVIRVREVAVEGRRAEQAARAGTSRRSPGVRQDYMNRNKKSICLNLKHPAARQAFYRLAERADVLLEGSRPGVAKRLGIDYETLRALNPRLIYCAITGYGQDGPYAHLVGHDINYASIAGAMGLMGPRNGPPVQPSQQLADLGGGGQGALIGILLALQARQRTGAGQFVDISMTDGVVSWLVTHAAPYFADGTMEARGDTLQTGRWPNYYVYETKD
ncbi:MAG: CoA transferase, partial [Chloroflexi bacterium]|nr:CoA transferase [Chloroflexota bacterium]